MKNGHGTGERVTGSTKLISHTCNGGVGTENISEFVEKLKNSKQYKKIRKDLIHQLKLKGAYTPTFINQVDDYMAMWVSKEMLILDIETRGAYITYDNGGGQKGTKKNDSIIDQVKINAQMLKLLDALDIKSTTIIADDNKDDDL